MEAILEYNGQSLVVDFSAPIDISLPLCSGKGNVEAFYLPSPNFSPFRYGNTVLSTREGGGCNCEVLTIAPHGNGTHTECVGHISQEVITINQCLKEFVFFAELVTILPTEVSEDRLITMQTLASCMKLSTKALVIRTLPNEQEKMSVQYSGTNPIYLEHEAAAYLRERGIEHLILDVPSVDREEDGGVLRAHHEYWQYPENPRLNATITELAFIPNDIPDGLYLLNLQIASLETDASPSKPVLYAVRPAL